MKATPFTVYVTALAHTQLTAEWSHCAYTQKVIGLCRMLKMLGHRVVILGPEDVEAPYDQRVVCVTKEEQARLGDVHGPEDMLKVPFDRGHPLWELYLRRAGEALDVANTEGAFLTLSAGWLQESLLPRDDMIVVEPGVGYQGITLRDDVYRAFESHTWRHQLIGKYYGAHGVQGRFQDRVIPGYLRMEDFPVGAGKGGYALFVGRMNEDKGVRIAAAAAAAGGLPLVAAGMGDCIPDGVDYRGPVGPAERARLMGGAAVLLAPTIYMEPFGNVVIEAHAVGTPTITTDFGAFVETNPPKTGFRCNTAKQFADAVRNVHLISRRDCRAHALAYSLENIAPKYGEWFESLAAMRGW